jgi:nucleotide-binding universal stress UspA family protein
MCGGALLLERSRTVSVPVSRRRSHVRRIGQPPTGYRRILVPLDGSDLAESALGHLDALARPTSEIVLLRAVASAKYLVTHAEGDPSPGLIESSEVAEDARRQAQEYLENVATPLRDRGLQVSSIVAVDGAAEAIVQAARQLDVELVAMASHGHGGVQSTLLGSVADAVVRKSSQPVLVLRVRGA